MVEDISASDRWVIPASVLRRIPGCAGGEAPLSVQLLHGGRNVNRNLRIDTRVGRFVLRQRIREGPRPGADPLREVACHRAAAAAGVALTPVTTHGDLNASNLIGSVPMLVDWEYAQLADPVYDLACLSVYYPGLRLRGGELLGTAGITDANGAARLRLYAQLFDGLNRLWEQAEALRQA
jgi:hypothetical protein